MHRRAFLAAAASFAMATTVAAQQVPQGYPGSYSELIAAANKEGALSIYSTTDAAEVAELLAEFKQLYPNIKVEYADQNSTELYSRFIAEAAAGATADFIWSSAMDLQIKLVNDGYAQAYASPEVPNLPDWANWKGEAYGTTAEPIVIAYNTRLVPAGDVPKSRADLVKLLSTKTADYQGKVTSYDPERSGVGFLYFTQDAQANAQGTWDIAKAMGQAGAKFYTSSGAMIEKVISGEHTIAYNMIGSYVLERQKKDPTLGIVFPSDYTLVMSRIAFIPKKAKNPNASKLFLDYLLSKRGQMHIAQRSMTPVRTDMKDVTGGGPVIGATAATVVRPIRVGPELLAYLDQVKRLKFIKDWQKALQGK
jgi:iron(III) transport system substrate-binding protein